jgi:hypothetical protein
MADGTVVNEGVITATFPPVESPPDDSPSDNVLVENAPERDPFQSQPGSEGRSSSEVISQDFANVPKPPIVTRPTPPPLPSPEPPLCTLVVDDDK